MPIRKFRSLEEMEDSLWRSPDDPTLSQAIARVWDFADRLTERRFPPGVHKHRSIEAVQQLRELWEEQNFRRFWESKDTSSQTAG